MQQCISRLIAGDRHAIDKRLRNSSGNCLVLPRVLFIPWQKSLLMDCPTTPPQVTVQCMAQQPAFWAGYNRQLSLRAVSLSQSYREQDTSGRTVDGVFNQETGTVDGFAMQGRWQGELGVSTWSLPIWVELDASASQGSTAYRGYLQQYNGYLIPYTSTTQNQWQTTNLRLGIPVAQSIGGDNPINLQWVPYVALQSSIWTRDLEQYKEIYSHQSWAAGLLLQWRWAEQWVAWVDALAVEAGNTRMQVPIREPFVLQAFDQNQYRQPQYTLSLGLSYDLTPSWSLQAQWQSADTRHQASAKSDGLNAPPSSQTQQMLRLGVGWRY